MGFVVKVARYTSLLRITFILGCDCAVSWVFVLVRRISTYNVRVREGFGLGSRSLQGHRDDSSNSVARELER